MIRNRPVSLALVGLFVWVSGCTSYRQIDLGDVPNHDRVRVTTPDGSWYMLDAPGIVSDTIKGHGAYPRTIPVEQVARVEARVPDHYETLGLVVGIIAAGAAVAYMALSATCYFPCD